MVPGAVLVFSRDLLEKAAHDVYYALGLMSLCLTAATIGKPFIDFVLDEAHWWMKTRKLREESDRRTSTTVSSSKPAGE